MAVTKTKTAVQKKAEYDAAYYAKNRKTILAKSKAKRDAAKLAKVVTPGKKRRLDAVTNPVKFIDIILASAKKRAKTKGMTFNITKEDLAFKILEANGSCQATGIPLSFDVNCDHVASIDRIDSKKGYVKGNIRIVASMFNYAKNAYSDEQFDMIARGWVTKRTK